MLCFLERKQDRRGDGKTTPLQHHLLPPESCILLAPKPPAPTPCAAELKLASHMHLHSPQGIIPVLSTATSASKLGTALYPPPFSRALPSPTSMSEPPSTPDLPTQVPAVTPLLLSSHFGPPGLSPSPVPQAFGDYGYLSSSLACCPLMVESPALSLRGLTDHVPVGGILIYGIIHPSGSSTRLGSHLSGVRVSRRHRARAGTSKVPSH